jgi:hypothetical protein
MTQMLLIPLIFGIPHVVSDFLNFYNQRSFSFLSKLFFYIFLCSILVLSFLVPTQYLFLFAMTGPLFTIGLIAFETQLTIRLVQLFCGYFAFYLWVWRYDAFSMDSFILVHNFIAFAAWIIIKPQDKKLIRQLLLMVLVVCLTITTFSHEPFQLLTSFLQLIHYLIWLKYIPAGESKSKIWLKLSWIAPAILLPLIYIFKLDIITLNQLYFRTFQFHGYMELVIVAHFICSRKTLEVGCTNG